MYNVKIGWGAVSLVVIATITISVMTMDNFSQQTTPNIPNEAYNQILQRQKDYPVVEYNAPEPSDPREREIRRQKSSRYDTRGMVVVNPNPNTILIAPFDAEPLPPAIPSVESDLIVVGEVLNSKASLSNNKKGIYSEYHLRVENILKDSRQTGIQPGVNISIDRSGGYVLYPNGQKVLYLIEWQYLPDINKRYLFFLQNPDQSPNFRIVTAYELKNGFVIALDNSPIFTQMNGKSEADFVRNIIQNVVLLAN